MTIKEIRARSGMSRAEFSRRYNIPIRSLENWESGERKPAPYLEILLERVVREDCRNPEMAILTQEGREAVENGDLSREEVDAMYKLHLVRQLSKIGSMADTFRASYRWIPEELRDRLDPADLAALADSFYNCYAAGKAAK